MDKANGTNLYLQLYQNIEREIINGQLRPGDRLPSYRWTAKKYGINMSTVIRAYNLLAADGIIEIIHGSGCYVKTVNCCHFFADKVVLENFSQGQVMERPAINFSSGTPFRSTYPIKEFSELLTQLIQEGLGDRLAYRDVQGSSHLRAVLAQYLAQQRITADPACIQILAGSQQGINILSQEIVHRNCTLMVSNPSYTVAINSLSRIGCQILSVPILEDGPDLSAMEEILKRKKVDFLYTMPAFQSPTNISISEEKKRQMVDLANRYGFFIIEDDCLSELSFDGVPLIPLKAFDTQNRVIYLKSFSKILMPGLRLACMVVPPQLVSQITSAKFYSDISSPDLFQECLARFIEEGKMSPHLDRMRAYYQEKHQCMAQEILSSGLMTIPYPSHGGLAFWVKLLNRVEDSHQLYERLRQEGVLFLPGNVFSQDGSHGQYIRLSYAAPTNDEIQKGIRIIAKALKEQR